MVVERIIINHNSIFGSMVTLRYRKPINNDKYTKEKAPASKFFLYLLTLNLNILVLVFVLYKCSASNSNIIANVPESRLSNIIQFVTLVMLDLLILMSSMVTFSCAFKGCIVFTIYSLIQICINTQTDLSGTHWACFYFLDVLFLLGLSYVEELAGCMILSVNRLLIRCGLCHIVKVMQVNMLCEMLILIITFVLIYILILSRKERFYYKNKLERRKYDFENLLTNLKLGTLCFKGGSLICYNKVIEEIITVFISLNDTETKENEIEKLLLTNITNMGRTDYNVNADDLRTNYTQLNKEYVYLGSKTISNKSNELTFEIWYKYKADGDCFSFIYKCLSEEELAVIHMKYRSSLLAKIAHELKNPLLSIGELLNQLNFKQGNIHMHTSNNSIYTDNYSDKSTSKRKKLILSDIKAYLEYLLLLIKDFSYLAKSGNDVALPINKCSLKELIYFIQKITFCLIRKHNKMNILRFIVDLSRDVPKFINTNEDGLKQVLINLITNGIKYTHSGHIRLKISKENDSVKFRVEDTGLGIKSSGKDLKELINSFQQHKIGLSIIYDLSSKLGKTVSYSTKEGKGSSFWFYIPLEMEIDLTKPAKCAIVEGENGDQPDVEIISVNESNDSEHARRDLDFQSQFEENDSSQSSTHSRDTVKIDNLVLRYIYPNTNVNTIYSLVDFINSKDYFDTTDQSRYVLVIDDEEMTRLSNIRLLNEFNNEHQRTNLIVLSAEDGIEGLYFIYICCKRGITVSIILSDQTMNFLDGTGTLQVINELVRKRAINKIPFYILTAYEDENTIRALKSSSPMCVFSKPMKRDVAQAILNGFE
jgi:signal transduction histidine kinase/CheY-like chemotaxis protein